MRTPFAVQTLLIVSIVLPLAACATDPQVSGKDATREVRDDGSVLVRYMSLPQEQHVFLKSDLHIGVVDGDPDYIFGDVRGVDAGSDGTIYVLDFQANELRAYSGDGQFDRIVVSEGEGPGEIARANGFELVGDTLLWIQDHLKYSMMGVDLNGNEQVTTPMIVKSYGYIWDGSVDASGMIWKPSSWSESRPKFPPDEGLSSTTAIAFAKGYNPLTGASDSMSFGPVVFRSFVRASGRGYSHFGIPFDAKLINRIEPTGGFWSARDHAYKIWRVDETADTLVTIEVSATPALVTTADRQEYIDDLLKGRPESGSVGADIAAVMPETKPVIADLVVDSSRRLWVRRVRDSNETGQFDVFDHDGNFLSTFELDFTPVPYLPIRVRNDRIYALMMDSLGVPVVVRTEAFSLR